MVSFVIDCSDCDLFCMMCLLKESMHHSLPPLQKCIVVTLMNFQICPNSPDLNTIDCKIWGRGMIWQRVYRTIVLDVND